MRFRSAPLFLLIACSSGKSPDSGTTGPGTPVTDETGTVSTGTLSGTPGGTPTGTTTGSTTTTPATDFCPALPAATGAVVSATPADDLQAALDGLSTGDTLELATGTYTLASSLTITTPGITVRSASGNRADVILDGAQTATHIFLVQASDVTLTELTLTNAYENGVHVLPALSDVTGTTLYDLALVDNAQYGVQISDATVLYADGGTIACSRIEQSDAGRPNVRNACRTAGIEAVRAQGWEVRDNSLEGFWCTAGQSPAAIRFWRGSRDTVVQRNAIRDSRRGILIGQGSDTIVRLYGDSPCGGVVTQHYGGKVHNNLVWATDPALKSSLGGIVDGISVESACEVSVLHNTVRLDDPDGGTVEGSIRHRYPNTTGIVANNLTHNTIRRLDGSLATANSNVENVEDYTWVSVGSGDFHIAPSASLPIDAGDAQWLTDVPEDVDGHDRSPAPDAGWDERTP